MQKMSLFLGSILFFNSVGFAQPVSLKGEALPPPNPWYVLLGAGYAWSQAAGIDNPNPAEWDYSNQGYDTTLGNSSFATIGVGKQLWTYFNFDVTYTYYANDFDYQKYQTGSSDTPGFTGNERTRFFELTNQNIMFNLTLQPGLNQWLAFRVDPFIISPFVGVGIGASFNTVNDFYTVGYIPFADAATGIGSTTSIGYNTTDTTSFAWQASAGLSFQPRNSYWVVDLGYRYYNGGTFYGPDDVIVNDAATGATIDSSTPWKGTLTTNEVFLNIRFMVNT